MTTEQEKGGWHFHDGPNISVSNWSPAPALYKADLRSTSPLTRLSMETWQLRLAVAELIGVQSIWLLPLPTVHARSCPAQQKLHWAPGRTRHMHEGRHKKEGQQQQQEHPRPSTQTNGNLTTKNCSHHPDKRKSPATPRSAEQEGHAILKPSLTRSKWPMQKRLPGQAIRRTRHRDNLSHEQFSVRRIPT